MLNRALCINYIAPRRRVSHRGRMSHRGPGPTGRGAWVAWRPHRENRRHRRGARGGLGGLALGRRGWGVLYGIKNQLLKYTQETEIRETPEKQGLISNLHALELCYQNPKMILWFVGGRARRGPRGGTPKDFTKPRQTIQSHRKTIESPYRLYKAPTDYTKPQQTIKRPKKAIQRHEILDKTLKY